MKLLLYCCKAKPYLYKSASYKIYYTINEKSIFNRQMFNGKVVAECDFEVETIHCGTHYEPEVNIGVGILPEFTCNQYSTETLGHFKLLEKSCLKDLTLPYEEHRNELDDYLQGKDGKAIYVEKLHIFDKPKELSDYEQYRYEKRNGCYVFAGSSSLENAPKNMCYVYDNNGNKCILISIHPEWLCKILNGECTIIVKKTVLKGMIK